jgi:beta-N-acetylhexosaminidase
VGALVAALLHGTDGARTAGAVVAGPGARDAAGPVAVAAPDGSAAGDATAADQGTARLVDRLSGAGSRVPRAVGPSSSGPVAAVPEGPRAPEPGSLRPSALESHPPQTSASEPAAPEGGGPGSSVPERRASRQEDPATRVVPAGCVPAPLTERAAAVLVVGLPGVTGHDEPLAREVVEVGVGGVFLSSTNVRTARQTTALVDGLQDAMAREHGRPLVVSTDEESGRVALARQVVGAGPSPRRLAQTRTPAEVEEFALDAGGRLAGLGITLDLAPVLDLDDGPADGVIGDRAFGADPEHVSAYAGAYWRGLASAGVAPTAKHFPGHGRSATDTHASGDVVEATLGELLRTDLVPFARAIEDGVPVVMLNHLGYRALDPHLPASLSPAAYAALREMGFEGVAMTDSLGMGAVHQRWDFPESVVLAIAAGADAALTTDGTQARAMRDALVDAVRTGALEETRLSEASARVTALAGGDPVAMSCLAVELPRPRSGDASTGGPLAEADPAAP